MKGTVKARLVNAAWRAFRPGSTGQKVAQWTAYIIIIAVLVTALTIVF